MKIFLDPGHNYSGADTGAAGHGLREQDVTHEIAGRLAALLSAGGCSVRLSREKVTDNLGTTVSESISKRAQMANAWGADLFISIHCNAGGGTGTETLVYSAGGASADWAKRVQKAVTARLGTADRGVKVRGDLGVLRLTDMPAVLVETAFIDNAKDAALLRDRAADFAVAIFEGITGEKEKMAMIYDYIDENMPEWARPTIQKLVDKGFLQGDETGALGLNDDMLRILVILDRAGVFEGGA